MPSRSSSAQSRGESSGESSDEEDERRRRKAILLLAVLFVLAALGAYAAVATPFLDDLFEGTGDLTVTVENQEGEPISGHSVKLVDPDTGEVVATGTTDTNGEVTIRNVDHGEYTVKVDGKSQDVTLDSKQETTTVEVTVTPPESNRPSRNGHAPHGCCSGSASR